MTGLGRKMLMAAVIQYLENLDDGELSEIAGRAQRMESTVRVLYQCAECVTLGGILKSAAK